MFAEIRERGMKLIHDLDPRAGRGFPQLELFFREDVITSVFNLLNENGDDVLTIAELQAHVLTLDEQPILLAPLLEPLALGQGGEDVDTIPGLLLQDLDKSADARRQVP